MKNIRTIKATFSLKEVFLMIKNRPIRLSGGEFIDMLYKSILRRESDLDGRAFHSLAIERADYSLESIANTIEAFINSSEARDTLFTRDALRFLNISPDFDDVISLGDHCLTSYLLKIYGLKKWSSPFDWLFSSPSMISHCLKDDFKIFLDSSFYKESNFRTDGSSDGRTVHDYYAKNYGISFVFNHHDLTQPTQYSYMRRCVERFRENARSNNKKLYLLIYDESSYPDEHINQLADDIKLFCSNHKFVAIKVLENTSTALSKIRNSKKNDPNFHHIEYVSANKTGPLRLASVNEEITLFQLLKSIG